MGLKVLQQVILYGSIFIQELLFWNRTLYMQTLEIKKLARLHMLFFLVPWWTLGSLHADLSKPFHAVCGNCIPIWSGFWIVLNYWVSKHENKITAKICDVKNTEDSKPQTLNLLYTFLIILISVTGMVHFRFRQTSPKMPYILAL